MAMEQRKPIYYVMGVSGCGKTTLGKALSERMALPFFDGDDFHPKENIAKMKNGIPLDDADRAGWLSRLNEVALQHRETGAVIACSALKEAYRKTLANGLNDKVIWVYIHGSRQGIHERLEQRRGHYMPSALLDSQFRDLEPPAYGIHIPMELELPLAVDKVVGMTP